jgi:thymidylate synthase (FAD)
MIYIIYMKVTLKSYSQSSYTEEEDKSIEDLIAYYARVSNPSNQSNKDTNERLLKYLINNNHWSPFEMVSICLEIETTRDIARQILRHRSFSFQEFSQRYAVASLGYETREARLQDMKNRQNSIENEDKVLNFEWELKQLEIVELSKKTYEWALNSGIAKEQARAVLPEGITISRMYMNGTLRSWIHYIQLRSGNGTQKEHRELAIECAKVISFIFPMIMEFVKE